MFRVFVKCVLFNFVEVYVGGNACDNMEEYQCIDTLVSYPGFCGKPGYEAVDTPLAIVHTASSVRLDLNFEFMQRISV